jgi:hypothetical protein
MLLDEIGRSRVLSRFYEQCTRRTGGIWQKNMQELISVQPASHKCHRKGTGKQSENTALVWDGGALMGIYHTLVHEFRKNSVRDVISLILITLELFEHKKPGRLLLYKATF